MSLRKGHNREPDDTAPQVASVPEAWGRCFPLSRSSGFGLPDAFPLSQWLSCRDRLGRYSSTSAPDSHRVPVRRAGSISWSLATGQCRPGIALRILLAGTAWLKWPLRAKFRAGSLAHSSDHALRRIP